MTRISVTAEHIAAGTPNAPYSCPITLAVEEALGNGQRITVLPSIVYEGSERERVADLPPAAQGFVFAFDNGGSVAPFTFELEFREEL